MIPIYLVRHAVAVDQADWKSLPDDDRPLTAAGRRKFRKLARAFGERREPVALVVTSPLPRAVMTAEIFARAARCDEVAVAESLRPGRKAADAVEEAAELYKALGVEGGVALVGHEPGMSGLVEALLGVKQPALEFKKGAIFRLDASAFPPKRPARFRWWLKPSTRERLGELPLAKESESEA